MKNLEVPKKYIDYIKSFVYANNMYQLSLNSNSNSNIRYYESTNKKAILEFLKNTIK